VEGNIGPGGAVVAGDETPPGIVGGGEGLVGDFVIESTELGFHVYNRAVASGGLLVAGQKTRASRGK